MRRVAAGVAAPRFSYVLMISAIIGGNIAEWHIAWWHATLLFLGIYTAASVLTRVLDSVSKWPRRSTAQRTSAAAPRS